MRLRTSESAAAMGAITYPKWLPAFTCSALNLLTKQLCRNPDADSDSSFIISHHGVQEKTSITESWDELQDSLDDHSSSYTSTVFRLK